MSKMVVHHQKYKELDGVDDVELISRSDHTILHNHLRKNGLLDISPIDLDNISRKAHERLTDRIIFQERMMRNVVLREVICHNQISDAISFTSYFCIEAERELTEKRKEYRKDALKRHVFTETVCPQISLSECIFYNEHTGNVCISSSFLGNNKSKLYRIKEE